MFWISILGRGLSLRERDPCHHHLFRGAKYEDIIPASVQLTMPRSLLNSTNRVSPFLGDYITACADKRKETKLRVTHFTHSISCGRLSVAAIPGSQFALGAVLTPSEVLCVKREACERWV